MIDIKQYEKDPESIERKLLRRGPIPALAELGKLVQERKTCIHDTQLLQEQRNKASDALKGASKEVIDSKRAELKELSTKLKEQETLLRDVESRLETVLLEIPNIPRDDVPDGQTEEDNVVLKIVGTPREFDFKAQDHVQIGERLGILDIERAAKVSGSRFAFLKGAGSRLNRALLQYMADFHMNRGDTELTTPYLAKEEALYGVGQLPKFKEDVFEVPFGDKSLYLISTSEVTLTNYYADEILPASELPKRLFAYSACFRSEAGSTGRDTHGLIRVHQFEKVEMMRIAMPEQADEELAAMVDRASTMLTELGLPHRIVDLCLGDLGFQAEKKIDLEVWLPGQNQYREISSCGLFGKYQARRTKIRYRPNLENGQPGKPEIAITLNGSGLPLGRTLVAILENYQQSDGSVVIPAVLRPYMGGLEKIG